ncbi:hypothetical protein CLOM_g10287 [Closterium sp. NIES-68]|nr:hypothetical protein CLOM_g10287 [Closterium sp. NIES-68]GJP78148.1 hypothetical protein CLOP_g8481 [Closterium sp. NIES-67]
MGSDGSAEPTNRRLPPFESDNLRAISSAPSAFSPMASAHTACPCPAPVDERAAARVNSAGSGGGSRSPSWKLKGSILSKALRSLQGRGKPKAQSSLGVDSDSVESNGQQCSRSERMDPSPQLAALPRPQLARSLSHGSREKTRLGLPQQQQASVPASPFHLDSGAVSPELAPTLSAPNALSPVATETHLMDMDMPMLAQAALAHSLGVHPALVSASSGSEASPSGRAATAGEAGEAAGCAASGEWPPSGWPQAGDGAAPGSGSGAHGESGGRNNAAAGEGNSQSRPIPPIPPIPTPPAPLSPLNMPLAGAPPPPRESRSAHRSRSREKARGHGGHGGHGGRHSQRSMSHDEGQLHGWAGAEGEGGEEDEEEEEEGGEWGEAEEQVREKLARIEGKLARLRAKREQYVARLQRVQAKKEKVAGPIQQWLRPPPRLQQ